MSEMIRRAIALARYGALTRPMFGKPRGTRDRAADRKEPVPGHYYPGTTAWFIVLDEPLDLDAYVEAMQMTNLSEEMRGAAVHVVEEYGDGSHVPALSRVLHEGPCERTRRRAATALACIGGPPAEESLWRALETETLPVLVREAALDGLLDLLTPDGWENYTFMNATRSGLSADVYDRIARVRGLSFDVTNILRCFDKEEIAKLKWPCPGKPEDLAGQPIGMYHCEFCGEMQLAGVPHLEPQFPEQWEEPFPKIEWPSEPAPVTTCPSCDAPSSITFTREEERFPYGAAPDTVELTAVVDKGRCSACAFEFTDWRAEEARDSAVQAHLQAKEDV